MLYRYTHPI